MNSRRKLNRGALQKLAALFMDNWWLKLLSLALAIIVYQTLKTEPKQNERKLNTTYRQDASIR